MLHPAPVNLGPDAGAAAFASTLQAEQDALDAFIGLLQNEQEVLIKGDPERLAAIAPDKAAQIDLLALLDNRRKRHLSEQNLPDSVEGMQSWINRNLGSATVVRRIWRELLARANTAHQLNLSNGRLIEHWMQQNRMKLTVLQTATASDNLYRADGQLRPLRSARSLDQA